MSNLGDMIKQRREAQKLGQVAVAEALEPQRVAQQAAMAVAEPVEEVKQGLDLLVVLIPVVVVVADKPMAALGVLEDQALLLYQYLLVITLAQLQGVLQ